MKLTPKQKSLLKVQAHHIDPVVQIGKNGITDELIAHIEKALTDHELIKIKFLAMKDEKESLTTAISEKTGAELVEIIGNIIVLYRPNN